MAGDDELNVGEEPDQRWQSTVLQIHVHMGVDLIYDAYTGNLIVRQKALVTVGQDGCENA
jgi:hypothetical protein